jgi:hypothetical protein
MKEFKVVFKFAKDEFTSVIVKAENEEQVISMVESTERWFVGDDKIVNVANVHYFTVRDANEKSIMFT